MPVPDGRHVFGVPPEAAVAAAAGRLGRAGAVATTEGASPLLPASGATDYVRGCEVMDGLDRQGVVLWRAGRVKRAASVDPEVGLPRAVSGSRSSMGFACVAASVHPGVVAGQAGGW